MWPTRFSNRLHEKHEGERERQTEREKKGVVSIGSLPLT